MKIKNINFVHLRLITEYSLKDGLIKIKNIIKELKKDNQSSIAITDDNLFGLISFYKLCIKNNIKPIIGCNLYIKNKLNKPPHKIIVLIKNKIGYNNLIKLINKSNLIENNLNLILINKNWLKNDLNKGLIILSGMELGDIGSNIINKKNYKKKALFWSKYFKNRFYIEISCLKKYKYYNKKVIELSKELNIPTVATHPIYFINKKDFFLYKIKNCILNKNYINKLNKEILKFKNFFFLKKKKIIKLFNKNKNSLINSLEICKKCNLFLKLNKIELPIFINKKKNNNKFLIRKTIKKLNNKFKKINIPNINYRKYKYRLLKECYISISIGISDYFLIVYDFIKWSIKNKIPKGPGRGSSTGSLISYVLDITNLDPIEYNLIFERFLNFKKISMPDFDIDFCPIKRSKIIDYIRIKYGLYSVSQIITFGKMAIKASIKDIGRVLGFNYNFINNLSKLIPFKYNNYKIKNILNKNLELNLRYNKEKEVKKLIKILIKFEGGIRNLGIHSGGIVISIDKIFNSIPLYIQNNILISQFSKIDIEIIGLLKFDFLGLKTLSVIYKCINNIKSNYSKIFLSQIYLNDKLCFNNLQLGKTTGIFQLESKGMQNMFIKAKPNSFNNIIALIALYRPGPIRLLNNFCLRKSGLEKIDYYHITLKEVLKETYGIIIYQEQIIFIVQIIANFSLENSDILRLAISKKIISEMAKQKLIFIKEGLKNGFSKKFLENMFNKIEKFSSYGFNKSHAAAYSLISYYTVWLKTYYFKEFMSSELSYSFNNLNKTKLLFNECIINNTYILPIDINKSLYNFSLKISKINKIRYGFNSIKGLGYNVIKEIIKYRKINLFLSFSDFYNRINKNIINNKIIETLISSGSFDSLNINRADLLNNYKNILNKNLKKISINLIKNYFWKFKTKILEERSKLGFFFLNHLINIYKNSLFYIFKKKNFKKNFFYGIIIEILEKLNLKEKFYILIIENKTIYKFKINYILYNKNKNIIKLFNFIIIFFIYKNYFFEINKIYNIDNFKIF